MSNQKKKKKKNSKNKDRYINYFYLQFICSIKILAYLSINTASSEYAIMLKTSIGFENTVKYCV